MSGAVVTVIVIVVVIAAAIVIALALMPRMRSRKLKERFGPEYDRAVEQSDNRRDAERELVERQKRHQQLQLRELTDDEKRRYTMQWAHVQEQFVDDPAHALENADRLLTLAMADRGYPTEDPDQRVADLSVEHAQPVDRFRRAHQIAGQAGRGQVSTEDMRAAIVDYRQLFAELVDGNGSQSDTAAPHSARDNR
ncbi:MULTISPECIES: hypothetical protein [unclassified Nocardia]|uniref:hypothetical protein n=1 Tax=unclassified Nocardia TaxID=2637762 RepID=UPI0035DC3C7C